MSYVERVKFNRPECGFRTSSFFCVARGRAPFARAGPAARVFNNKKGTVHESRPRQPYDDRTGRAAPRPLAAPDRLTASNAQVTRGRERLPLLCFALLLPRTNDVWTANATKDETTTVMRLARPGTGGGLAAIAGAAKCREDWRGVAGVDG